MFDPERSSRPILQIRPVLISLVMIAALVSVIGELSWNGGAPAKGAETETAASANEDEVPPKRVTEKQIKAYSGLAALAGIVIVGLAMAALIVLWAGRLRRQIRRPARDRGLPERDFWFLKPPKPTVTESSLPDAHQPPHQSPQLPDEPDSKNDN